LIRFRKLRYKNFLSTGNLFTEIELDAAPTTLIVGENGAGKSSFACALCYALYGRTFRPINKPKIVNSITQKGMVVELEFEVASKEYLVRRGMKPNLFEIYRDGALIDQGTGVIEYQDVLEKQILKMNYKTFIQIVILGSTNYVPFMRLPAYGRREIIEDLLDIQVFSIMNVLLKEKNNQNKAAIAQNDQELAMVRSKIELNNKHLEALKLNHATVLADRQLALETVQKAMQEDQDAYDRLQQEYMIVTEQHNFLIKDWKKYLTYKNYASQIASNKAKVEQEIKFYDNENCPTCRQAIDVKMKAELIRAKKPKLEELQAADVEIAKELDAREGLAEQIRVVDEKRMNISERMVFLNSSKVTRKIYEKEIQDEIRKLQKKSDSVYSDQSEALEEEFRILTKNAIDLVAQREMYNAAHILLKDGGIKAKIVEQYIPVINGLLNRYLEAMDFFVSFHLDDNFNETIKSRFRDNFSYESFSEGEKQRINLAILFAWIDVAKLRNSASCNLLIMDEVLDGSLDAEVKDHVLKLINDISATRNVFIISHNMATQDKFTRVLEFKKIKNFSRIAA
jgi:DNA repair exonuclease SbcCD ATPase subunit